MNWQTLVDFNMRIRQQNQLIYQFMPEGGLPGLELIESVNDLWNAEADEAPYNLLDILRFFRQRQCSDPRDKILALLRVAVKEGASLDHMIDYSQSVSELYTKVSRTIIDSDRSLDILWSAGKAMQAHDLPSWVPDWTVPSNAALGMLAKEGFEIRAFKEAQELEMVYHATNDSTADYERVQYGDKSQCLRVKARLYGKITSISASFQHIDEAATIPITATVQLQRMLRKGYTM